MSTNLLALRSSVEHLRTVAGGIDPAKLDAPAYPAQWSIADVFSHVGSGAVIMEHNLRDVVEGRETDGSFNQATWDEWNAKGSETKVADALEADRALLERLEGIDDDHRGRFSFSMGPIHADFDDFVGLRLNEHALHTWDVEVSLDPSVTIPSDVADAVIDHLDMVVRFSGKASGGVRTVNVRTVEPRRDVAIIIDADSVKLTEGDAAAEADLELPAEAFIRLTYGRLDPGHTPPGAEGPVLDGLRSVFPGI